MTDDVRLIEGDCLEAMRAMPAGSVDCVVTDPPYPCVKRSHGTWTEAEWFSLMRAVVPECMRALKPSGSAVFILQPNSERDGRLRTWLWEFMLWVGKEWGIVQDAWWWNTAPMPAGNGIRRTVGLMRSSVKACVWVGPPGCVKNQDAVLLPSTGVPAHQLRRPRVLHPSGHMPDYRRMHAAVTERGGSTPMNLLPFASDGHIKSQKRGRTKHCATTPMKLCRWWARYICPPGGTVLDPFAGSGTAGLAALAEGRKAVLIEREPAYCEIIRKRLADHAGPLFGGRQPGLFDQVALGPVKEVIQL